MKNTDLSGEKEHKGEAFRVFDQAAEAYQENHGDVSKYAASLRHFLLHLPDGPVPILDLACGPGNLSRFLLDQRPELQILGLDLAPNMLRVARNLVPEGEFRELDCREVGGLDQEFAGIVCGFALPYLSKEESLTLVRDAAKILQPGGLLYLSTMETDAYHSHTHTGRDGHSSLTQFIHEAGYLVRELELRGLNLIYEERIRYPDGKGGEVCDLVLTGQKT